MKKLFTLLITLFTLSLLATFPVSAGVNDFSISDYRIDMDLSKDSDGRSTLKTVEIITAQFPDFDQNHGIERAIPKSYDGHPTSLKIVSVNNALGEELPFETYGSGDNEVVRIGDEDEYVQGAQTYVITYTQRDVTKYFADTKSDEFYWDTNGTEWLVPIQKLAVTVNFDDSVKSQMNGNTSCYQGTAGEQVGCGITQQSASQYQAFATNLAPGENVTVAVGFAAGTFAAYEKSVWDWIVLGIIALNSLTLPLALWFIVSRSIRAHQIIHRSKEIGTIVPEYLPPKDRSVTAAATVGSLMSQHTMTAQLLDLAVRHYIKIYETKQKSTFKAAEYDIEIVKDVTGLKWEERELLSDMFDGNVAVGERMNVKALKNNIGYYTRTQNNDKDLAKLIKDDYKLREVNVEQTAKFRRTAKVLLVASLLTLSLPLATAAAVVAILSFTLTTLTDKGLELSRYLKGLKMYIEVAEQERIKLLQSPEGAAKVGADIGGDQAQLITLYERVLPYAVLFGQEKQWAKQLGSYYEAQGSTPNWYSGNSGTFNAAVFASSMSGFSTANSYATSSSSSSGGSGGGGSSGGGGGGGGGGGW